MQISTVLQVKSYSFSPDSGRINAFQYDEVGLSWLLPALIGTWEIGVEFVSMVDSTDAIILLPGAEARRKRVADGWLEVAFIGLQVWTLYIKKSTLHLNSLFSFSFCRIHQWCLISQICILPGIDTVMTSKNHTGCTHQCQALWPGV